MRSFSRRIKQRKKCQRLNYDLSFGRFMNFKSLSNKLLDDLRLFEPDTKYDQIHALNFFSASLRHPW